MFIAMLRIFNCLPVTYTEEKKLANRFSHPVIISQFISTLTQIFIAVINEPVHSESEHYFTAATHVGLQLLLEWKENEERW